MFFNLALPTSGSEVTLIAPATPVTPPPAATVTWPTNFRWTLAAGDKVATVVVDDIDNGTEVAIVTGDTQVDVPDLSVLGIAFPTGTHGSWRIEQFQPGFLTMNDYAAASRGLFGGFFSPDAEVESATTAPSAFLVGP
jgi:hypothetical protein